MCVCVCAGVGVWVWVCEFHPVPQYNQVSGFCLDSCTCRTNQVLQIVGSRSKSTENNKEVKSNNSKKKKSKKKEGTMHCDAEDLYRAMVRSK